MSGRLLRAIAASVAVVGLGAGLAGPARADGAGPVDLWSSVVVTRLTLDDGHGVLTLQAHLRTEFNGFEVQIPAAGGSWSGPDTVAAPDLGTTCRRDPGPDLHYRCGVTQDGDPAQGLLPTGGYQIAIPVSYDGSADGLTGSTTLVTRAGTDGFETFWPFDSDTFPVYTAGHFRSTAEGAVARLGEESDSSGTYLDHAQLAVTLTVVPGETVTALDLALPVTPYVIRGSNAPGLGLQCYRRPAGPSIHCKPATGRSAFPAGRHVLTLDLLATPGSVDDGDPPEDLTLTVDGSDPEVVDTMPWRWESWN